MKVEVSDCVKMFTGICKCKERLVSLNEGECRTTGILIYKETDRNPRILIEKYV
jgi:hypothetical protein